MDKKTLSKQGTRAARAWVWPLAACALVYSPLPLQAVPLATGIELQAPVSATISKAEKINPTTVELTYADGSKQRLHAGDTAYLPAHCRHRVSYTSKPCVWLCVFRQEE